MICRVIMFWLLGASLAWADLPRSSRILADSFQNDAAHRLIAITDPLQRPTLFAYDNDSHQTNAMDAMSNNTAQFWNARGNLVKVIDAASNVVGRAYDGAGNLIFLTNRNSNVWTFQYDGANRLTNTISPLGHSSSRVYNNRGLLQSTTDPLTNITSFSYDARARMTNQTDNLGTINCQYDGNNNLTLLGRNVGSGTGSELSWAYDAYNRATSFTNAAGYVIQYRYDNNGNLTNLIYPGNRTVNYYYDGNNRLTNVTDWANRQTTFSYDLAGHMTSITRPNTTLRLMSYDADGELTNIIERTTDQFPIAFFTLSYNPAGRVQWEFKGPLPHTNTPPSRTMTFDQDNRLKTFNGTNVTIDNDGSLTYGPLTNNTFGTYSYDALNELTSAGGWGYGYDPAKNRVLLVQGTNFAIYVIDSASSQVLMRMKNGTTNYYIYGAGLLYEIDETASTTNTAFYHFDCRGSTVTLTDGYGNPTDLIEYGPYGTMTYHAGTNTTPFLYNGQFGVQTDPNGLLYMRARYYNPYISRFINADPSGFGGGLNFYQFASGNPISYWDPTGLCAGGTPADTQNPFNLNFNPSQYTQPCIMCHGSSAFGFNGNINSFSGLSAIPGSGANAQQGYATEAFIAQTVTPFIAGPAGGLIADALDAGAITAATDATITAAAGGATSATTINLAEGEAALVLTQNGNLVAQQPVGSMLSHAEFASQYGALASDGSLAPGYWVGTIGKVNGQVVAMNSMTFYGNQLPNYNATIALGSAFH